MRKLRKQKNKKCSCLIFLFMVGVVCNFAACGEKSQPVEKTKAPAQKQAKKEQVKPPVHDTQKASKEVVAYHYDPMGKKDPFEPLVREEKKIAEQILMTGELTPLQKYALTDLILVAIIVGIDSNKAMVEDSKGDGYIISKGTLIGNKFGEVTEIKKNEVVIVEKEIDRSTGGIIRKETSLILRKPEEEDL